MTLVVDASVALKWVLQEPGTDAALALQGERLIAPALWLVEVANALWRHVRIGELTGPQAVSRMTELAAAPVISFAVETLASQALTLAIEVNHPVYDCLYLALALRHDTHVVTDDRPFLDAIATRPDLAGRVRLLGS